MINENKARDELESILGSNEYQVYYVDNRNFLEKWWEDARSWIADLLSNWFSSFERSIGMSDAVSTILVVSIVALIIIASFLIVRNYRRKRVFHDHKPLQSVNETNWSFYNHLAEAEKQEDLKQYAIATRHLFLALLLYFHEKEWLEAKMWKTNWEYYDELEKVNQAGAEQFYNLALIFDEVTYGERAMEQEGYSRYRREVMNWLEVDNNEPSSQGKGGMR